MRSLWQVLPPWHEPNIVHVRLPFLQPDLWDIHSCSLLFVGALDKLQHFIWSLELIEWGKFRCKVARFFIFGPTILSCIKRGRVCYKSISPYGDLYMFMGYVFIERVVGWRQWFLLWGICQCLPTTYNSSGPNKINESLCLRNCLLVSKCVEPYTQDFQCDTFANSKSRLPLYYRFVYFYQHWCIPCCNEFVWGHVFFVVYTDETLLFIARNSQGEFLWWQLSCFT